MAKTRFVKGERVTMTRLGDHTLPTVWPRQGRFVGFCKNNPVLVRIQLDGHKTAQRFHVDFWQGARSAAVLAEYERRARPTAVAADYERSGSLAATARTFGISRQRVHQIVCADTADTPTGDGMKKSSEYFNGVRPFNAADDACLLDALEQGLAVMAECDVPTGWLFNVVQDAQDAWWIEVISEGDGILGHGKTLRDALRVVFSAEHDPFYDVAASSASAGTPQTPRGET